MGHGWDVATLLRVVNAAEKLIDKLPKCQADIVGGAQCSRPAMTCDRSGDGYCDEHREYIHGGDVGYGHELRALQKALTEVE